MKTVRHQISIPIRQIADVLSVELPATAGEGVISGFASLAAAGVGDLSFLSNARFRRQLEGTRAAVVLVPTGWSETPSGVIALAVANPSAAFDQLIAKYTVPFSKPRAGIHLTAVIKEWAQVIPERISVGANAVIESGAIIEEDVEIGAGCYVGRDVHVGRGSRLFPNVTVLDRCVIGRNVTLHSGAVIGADGFGYEFIDGRHRKIPQTGIVQIDNDVEIGANTTIDRARFGRTWIGEGTKIDNQVQIAHNVIIGKHCVIVAGVGIAGSAQIEDYVVIAAQAGVAGHITVGAGCILGARCGVTKSLPAKSGSYMGFPAAPASEERRRIAAGRQIPELLSRVRKLEKSRNGKSGQASTAEE
jgi:UDP-3-O-[3-hydroxymyristoyl] glucosamine N-acyltransferase